ncbi:hypothetical protein HMPREF0063_11858 [Aeromicrobium marinum DSM 15272]|uniref:Uncharacterized protein n=1 Tax=Aeromicrobium marinum DSM 15272 TaxID=585531 RepID=E2SDS2_9ACTN|nr:DUF2017 domain-containing protein [Aeromicrobium marinum]EFQ82649.1 hypothetical protein HMPREF0063_11858 [Aeromicrobium marinum DSM 15272]
MKAFKRRRRGGFVATFDAAEAQLLVTLARQVVELLMDRNGAPESDPDPLALQLGMGGPATPPEDPVLQRLLPDAYRDDAEESGEFRRFTERTLTTGKVANAEAVIGSLVDGGLDPEARPGAADASPVEVELDPAAAQAWLRTLNDIRLAVAVRLGIEDEEDAHLAAHSTDDAVIAMSEIYDWLGYVQETLVQSLD